MQSLSLHIIHGVLESVTNKTYTTCIRKIEKANQIKQMLLQNTYTNEQITILLTEFLRIDTPILHLWNKEGITTLDLVTKELKTYALTLSELRESITFDGRVFILNAKSKGELSEFDFEHCTLMARQKAPHPKFAMGVCECDQYIYSIGGGKVNEKDEIGYSEKYDVRGNKWIVLPNLKKSRAWNCAAQFDHQWIYTFYGTNN